MRGKFGKPLVVKKFDSSVIVIPNQENSKQSQMVQTSDLAIDVQKKQDKRATLASQSGSGTSEADLEDLLESDEAGEFYGGDFASEQNINDSIDDIVEQEDEEDDANTTKTRDADKMQNWRSLFN